VRTLLAQHDDIADLEVRRATLEDTYLAMVHQVESDSGRRVTPLEPIEPSFPPSLQPDQASR
jgi:hypothetical protein